MQNVMSQFKKPLRGGNAVLILAILALSAVLAWEINSGAQLKARLQHVPRPVASTTPLTLLPPFALAPEPAYAGIVQHTLFLPGRGPAMVSEAAVASPPKNLKLLGVAIQGSTAIALVKDTETGKTERLTPADGKDAQALKVQDITDTSAVVVQNGQQIKLELHVQRSMPAAVSAQSASQPAQGASKTPPASAPQAGRLTPASKTNASPGQIVVPMGAQQLANINAIRAKMGLQPLHP